MTTSRRDFISLVGSATAAWPLQTYAQGPGPVVGLLSAGVPQENLRISLLEGLKETGYVEGQNVALDYRWARGDYDRLPEMAMELVHRNVAVIATVAPIAALAAKRATTSIPIVFSLGSDPVRDGLVDNLAHPSGNITGATFFNNLLDAKRLDLLHRIDPEAKVLAALFNPKNPNFLFEKKTIEEAANAIGLSLAILEATNENEIDRSFVTIKEQHAEGLIIAGDAFLNGHGDRIAALALDLRIPTCFTFREEAVGGGLMSYGASVTDTFRKAGTYIGRILKGEKPSDLPVQQPTKFEFVLNLKTAKVLGLSVPSSIQLLADEVVE